MAGFIQISQDVIGDTFGGGHQLMGDGSSSYGVGYNFEPGAGFFGGAEGFLPFDILVKKMSFAGQTAPGMGKNFNFRIKLVDNQRIGSIFTISDLNTAVESDQELVVPGGLSAAANYINTWATGTNPVPPSSIGMLCTGYEPVSQPRVSLYEAGSDGSSAIAAANIFAPFTFINFISTNTTEAPHQTPWPVPATGKFQYIIIISKGLGASDTVQIALRKNGADTAFVYNLTQAAPNILDLVTTASVTGGGPTPDLVNWRIQRTAGTSTTITIGICIGFVPP